MTSIFGHPGIVVYCIESIDLTGSNLVILFHCFANS